MTSLVGCDGISWFILISCIIIVIVVVFLTLYIFVDHFLVLFLRFFCCSAKSSI